MPRISAYILILTALSFPLNKLEAQEGTSRPKVGLVLSGGGAKGLAHIGVLKVLEEVGMPIDYIGGTSMGALVGGLYSIGYSADSLEDIVNDMDWDLYFTDRLERKDLSWVEKKDRDNYLLSFPIGKKGIMLPEGIIKGQHITNRLSELCLPVYDINDFSRFPTPFLCISTDIRTGTKIVHHDGSLPLALRASMAIPTVFAPVNKDSLKLVDGGVIDNFPVKEVVDMGADIIIGVDVGTIKVEDDEYDLFSIMKISMFMHSTATWKEQMAEVDIYIEPELKKLGAASFSSSDSLIAYGEVGARKHISRLSALADSLNSLPGVVYKRAGINKRDSLYISEIKIKGLKKVTRKALISDAELEVKSWLSSEEIMQAVSRIYNSNKFESAYFDIKEDDKGANILGLNLEEKDRSELRFGFYYDLDTKASLYLNAVFYNKLLKDSKMSITTGLGRSPCVGFQYLINRGAKPAPGTELSSRWTSLYVYSDSTRDKLESYNYSLTSARFFIRSNLSGYLDLRLGAEWTHAFLSPNISLVNFGYLKDNFWAAYIGLYSDTYNDMFHPDNGNHTLAEARFATNKYIKPVIHLKFFHKQAISITKKLSLHPSVYAAFAIGDSIPALYSTSLGGMHDSYYFNHFPFVGYKYYEVANNNVLFGRLNIRYKLFNKNYLSFMYNAGFHSPKAGNIINSGNIISGYGLMYSLDTPIGPAAFSLLRSGEKKVLHGYIQLGYRF